MRALLLTLFATTLVTTTCVASKFDIRSRAGRACMFEGDLSQLAVGAPVRPGQAAMAELTFAFWYRCEAVDHHLFPMLTYGTLMAGTSRNINARYVVLGAQSTAFLDMFGQYTYSDSGIKSSNVWTHVAATWRSSDGQIVIYENGSAIANITGNNNGSTVPTGGRFFFPDYLWDSKFFGVADEISAWARCLSAGEIARLSSGDLAVRISDMILRWSCDELDDNATTAGLFITDLANSQGPAVVDASNPVRVVPSTCPAVSVSLSVVSVVANATTELLFPTAVTISSPPILGSLSVGVGASASTVTYTPPPGGLAEGVVDAFETSYATVEVQANRAPAPHGQYVALPEIMTAITSAAYWDYVDNTYRRHFAYMSDADGDALSAAVAVLPLYGHLCQTDGTPITAAGTAVTDGNLAVVFNATDDAYGRVVAIAFDVTDGLATVRAMHYFNVTLPDRMPSPVSTAVSVRQDSATGAAIALDVLYDPAGDAVLVVSSPPQLGVLYDAADGSAIAFEQMTRYIQQWASEVVNFSSEYRDNEAPLDYSAATILGPPDSYPVAGDSVRSWAQESEGGTFEWIVLRYGEAVDVYSVTVYEVLFSNCTFRISLLDERTQRWYTVFQRAPQTMRSQPMSAQAFAPPLLAGFYPIRSRTVRLDLYSVPNSYPEIDAVRLAGTLPVVAAHISGRSVRYMPNPGARGRDSFEFGVELLGAQEMGVVSRMPWWSSPTQGVVAIDIASVNYPPVAYNSSVDAMFDGTPSTAFAPVAVSAAFDPNGENLTYAIDFEPRLGTLRAEPNASCSVLTHGHTFAWPLLQYSYSCNKAGVAFDDFSFRAIDREMQSLTGTVHIKIYCAVKDSNPSNDASTKAKERAISGLIAGLVVTVALASAAVVSAALLYINRHNLQGFNRQDDGSSTSSVAMKSI